MTETESKQFATLAAEYAMLGHALIKAQPSDTEAPYYAAKWGWLKPLHNIEAAQQLLDQIKGSQ